MYRRYLELFKQKRSHYISWNSLFLWGFGLWIALCTSNVYHSVISKQQDLEVVYNISTKTEAIEEMLHITRANYIYCNVIIMLKTVLQYVYVFVSISFVILFACSYSDSLKKAIKIWNNVMFHRMFHRMNFYSAIFYFTTFIRSRNKNIFNKSDSNKSVSAILESKLMPNFMISTKYLKAELSCDDEEDKWTVVKNKNKNILDTNINIIQSEIIFSSYTLLFFNNYELYQYFNNQYLKNHLLMKYFVRQDSEHIGSNLKTSNKYKRNNNTSPKQVIQRGIVSSSPEFKKFLANLKTFQFFYPYMLEVSTNYMIRIKLIK